MNVPISGVQQPTIEGLCLVKRGENVGVYYRNPDGQLEANPCMEFVNSGGIHFNFTSLSAGSVFVADANGRITCGNPA